MSSSLFKRTVVPIIHIQYQLNSERTYSVIERIEKASTTNLVAIALIVDLPNQMPVQVDKLMELLKRLRAEKQIPVYGFTASECSPQSYYMLSMTDRIYTSPTTIFNFKRQLRKISYDKLMSDMGLRKTLAASSENLLGKYIDAFTSPDTVKYGNQKETDIGLRLSRYSIANRNQQLSIQNKESLTFTPEELPSVMIGKDAVKANLADDYGFYEDVLKEKYPTSSILKLDYANEKFTVLKIAAIITSPILIGLFLFKVLVKWTLIITVWIKSKSMREKSAANQT